jgi:hypothetical protein
MKRRKSENHTNTKKQKNLSVEENQVINTGIGDYNACAMAYIRQVTKEIGDGIKYDIPNQEIKDGDFYTLIWTTFPCIIKQTQCF